MIFQFYSILFYSILLIKVVEKTGTTLKRQLQVSNPFRPQQCGRDDCFECSSGGGGNCHSEGITYEIGCEGGCGTNDEYKGESSGNAYTRGANIYIIFGHEM